MKTLPCGSASRFQNAVCGSRVRSGNFRGDSSPVTINPQPEFLPLPSHALSNLDRALGHDAHIDHVHFDNQNIYNVGPGKGSSLRRNASTCLDRNNCRGGSSGIKPARHQRISGIVSTTICKRWEKAAYKRCVTDLLYEVSHNIDANGIGSPLPQGSQCLYRILFTCDSFDASIAAHVNKHVGKNTFQPSIISSIWDARETRDAFSFTKNVVFSENVQSSKENRK